MNDGRSSVKNSDFRLTIPRPIAHLALKPTPDSSIFPQQGTIQSEPFIAAFLERGPS